MAAERQQHRTRQECDGRDLREPHWTKTRTDLDWHRRDRPDKLRCASPHPRKGQQWTKGVPSHGCIQAAHEQPSQAECDQRTRGCAEAHAGPEPDLVPGRNRHKKGETKEAKQYAQWPHRLVLILAFTLMSLQPSPHVQGNKWHETIHGI
eukprot:5041478-Pleurochrysis_carterae.AAC.1